MEINTFSLCLQKDRFKMGFADKWLQRKDG